jgi:hypothetical protein
MSGHYLTLKERDAEWLVCVGGDARRCGKSVNLKKYLRPGALDSLAFAAKLRGSAKGLANAHFSKSRIINDPIGQPPRSSERKA